MVKQSSKELSKEKIKKKLEESFVYYEKIGKEDLKARVNNVEDYENIIKKKKKNIIRFTYQHGKIFKKFIENRKFKNLLQQLKINEITVIFKRNIVKLVDKYPKILTSSIALNFLKSYYKDIKNICKEKQEELFSSEYYFTFKN